MRRLIAFGCVAAISAASLAMAWQPSDKPSVPAAGKDEAKTPQGSKARKKKSKSGKADGTKIDKKETVAAAVDKFELKLPFGLPPLPVYDDNPLSAAKIELGKQLYFDKRLSRDNTVSCASCHDPAKGWSNAEAFATGVRGQKGGRSAPTIINSIFQTDQFWDGRAHRLEGQALGPIQNPIEMDLTLEEAVARLNKIPGYKQQFQAIFKTDATPDAVAKAIAAFEATVLSGDAPYDRFKAGDKAALSEEAQRGLKVFTSRAHCSACHTGANFTDGAYHNIGVGMEHPKYDAGRQGISKIEGDTGSFKTPTLREIAKTGPYMHDGRFKTLREVIDYYDKGGTPNKYLDEEIYPLKLSEQEKKDLEAFLVEGLSSSKYPMVQAPALPQ